MARVFAIKSTISNDVYYGVSTSTNEKANPLRFLYSKYQQNPKSFTKLGDLVKEQGISNFRYAFLKSYNTKDEAVDVCAKLRERPEATLNSPTVMNKDLFKDQFDVIKNVITDSAYDTTSDSNIDNDFGDCN